MKILKFKKLSKGKYKLLLDNNDSITLYEDVIINNNLLLTKEIEKDSLDDLIKQNNEMHVYGMAINYISIRMRSISEIREYLKRKEVSPKLVDEVIEKLIKNGYLNDFNFTKAYVNDQLLLTNKGPSKIKQELIKHGIDNDVIKEALEDIDNDMLKEKLSNLIEKQVKIKKGSANSLRTKLVNYFSNLGYDRKMIIDELDNYKFKSDPIKLEKDYNKLMSKYSGKYKGSELLYFISGKLYAKGYTKEDIKKVVKEDYYE